VSSHGSDPVILSQAVADLKAMDARLAALIATYPSAEASGPDLGAPIRESRALVRAAIGLLSGALLSSEAPTHAPGTGKRRVKIKAESASTASGGRERVETAVRSEAHAPQEPGKRTAHGGNSARRISARVSASASAMASTQERPPNSLLARLGAATSEPPARHPDAAEGTGVSFPAPAPQAGHVSARAAAERLERLEAEIDSLTEASTTGDHRSRSATTAAPGVPASKTAQSQPPSHAAAAASASEYRQGVDGAAAADDEDDAEIVIITSQTGGRPARQGTPPVRQSPRIFSDQSSSDDDDAEVEIVQPGTRPSVPGRAARAPTIPEGERAKVGASAPVAPAKWRLFRGSR
jgi:hypothetical protein